MDIDPRLTFLAEDEECAPSHIDVSPFGIEKKDVRGFSALMNVAFEWRRDRESLKGRSEQEWFRRRGEKVFVDMGITWEQVKAAQHLSDMLFLDASLKFTEMLAKAVTYQMLLSPFGITP